MCSRATKRIYTLVFMSQCYLCRNAEDAFIKAIPTYVADRVSGMHMSEVCLQISDALREQKGVSISTKDVHEHVTRHICDKRIDACVALQELKSMANLVKGMAQQTDEENGITTVDTKVWAIYLETVKQIMTLHRSI